MKKIKFWEELELKFIGIFFLSLCSGLGIAITLLMVMTNSNTIADSTANLLLYSSTMVVSGVSFYLIDRKYN